MTTEDKITGLDWAGWVWSYSAFLPGVRPFAVCLWAALGRLQDHSRERCSASIHDPQLLDVHLAFRRVNLDLNPVALLSAHMLFAH